ncbi:MFS transporter [Citrobacter youngae]|uniref:Transporter, major facilitator family protein n=1 Tax=Citrobacter youngae ATCC 29220 TaxID=500640 RepID=D4BJY2_9ENTR|nr:MFS transporter [Citrobacter youngae]EFE05997.1 transporter, major facilitator family protein [Citrobacter youngae ATCC 29220]
MADSAYTRVPVASMAIAALSTIVEWYDFTLYLYFATVLSRVFFGGGDMSLIITLSGFAVSYLLRPLGAVYFGQIGDKYGRRQMMLISMALMTSTMLLTALLPTHQQVGSVAGISILILRAVMAFSVGGEYTGVVAYLLESATSERRGLITSLASAASEVGGLIAVGVSAITVNMLSPASLEQWGWRVPFLIGAVLAAVLWAARTTLRESPDFEQYQSKSIPLTLSQTISRYRQAVGRTFAISALGSITYYIGIVYIPVFLVSTGIYTEKNALSLSTIAAFSVIVVTPITGHLSDRLGRKPVLLFLTCCCIALPLMTFRLMAEGNYLLTMCGSIVLACIAGGISAVGTSATAEQFSIDGRLMGLALGTTAATALFGGLTPYLAQVLTHHVGGQSIPGIMIMAVALFVLPVFMRMSETAPKIQCGKPDDNTQ